jgi:hypothetical protein
MLVEQRPKLPWTLWIVTVIAAPLIFYIVDPAIWVSPIGRLIHSFTYEWNHSVGGHEFFIAGSDVTHVQKWAIAYIVFTKMSAFLTIPAVFFVIFALVQLVRFHLRKDNITLHTAQVYAYVVIWLLSSLTAFSLLNIVVGTHYHLPLATPVAIAGVFGLIIIVRSLAKLIFKQPISSLEETHSSVEQSQLKRKPALLIPLVVVALLAIVPHLLGLVTVYGAEGYTTEFFGNNENNTLQVAYIGYREALVWLESNQADAHKVGLIATGGTLTAQGYGGINNSSWFYYNKDLTSHFQLNQIDINQPPNLTPYQYLVWPKHLVQRNHPLPSNFHVIHEIMGGNTIYCYILEANS